MKSTKKAFLLSMMSMLLCVAMLVGTTFAWFTDSVTSGANKIVAGNLDIEVEYMNDNTNGWKPLQDSESVFSKGLWEPGHTEFVTLKIENKGTLALNYKALITPVSENGGINVAGEAFKLSDYLVFKTVAHGETEPQEYTRDTARADAGSVCGLTVNELTQTGSLEAGKTAYVTLIVYMPEEVGNAANYKTGTPAPTIELGIKILATQKTSEADSFNDQYDAGAIENPVYVAGAYYDYFEAINVSGTSDSEKKFEVEKTVGATDNILASATGETENAGDTVTLTVVKSADAETNFTATVAEDHELNGYDIKVTGQKEGTLVQAKLYVGTGLQDFKFYHNDTAMTLGTKGALTDGEYCYDSTEGYVYFASTTFSPFQATYVAPEASIGAIPYGTLKDALKAAKTGDTVTILKNVVAELPNAFGYNNEPVYEITAGITLDGNWKTVTASTETWAKYNDKITGMIFSIGSQNANYTEAANVIVKNLTVIGHKDMKHGFSIVKSANANTTATFENVTVKNCGANAFSVNGTTATMTNVKTSNCGWGAIDASEATLTVKSGEYDIIKNNKNSTVNLEGGKVDIVLTDNETVYHIYTAEGLRTFAVLANAGVAKKAILEADIDLENVEWTQIDGAGKSITFDGNGKTIKNLKISDGHNAGFFKTGTWCEINNLTIDGATVTGIGRIGVICGHGLCVDVDNCTVKNATVTAVVTNNDDGDKAGAIVGYLSAESNGSVTNCKVENVTVKGYRDVGALVGYAAGTYTITDNTLANIRVICDKSNNYKNYTTDDAYDVNFIVGEKTDDGTYARTGIIAGTYDVDPRGNIAIGYCAEQNENVYVVVVCTEHEWNEQNVCTKCGAKLLGANANKNSTIPQEATVITTQEALNSALTAAAAEGENILYVGEGTFGINDVNCNGKTITFICAGFDKTTLQYGSTPASTGGEAGSNYSFEHGNLKFVDATLKDVNGDDVNFKGFVRVNNITFQNCVIKSRLTYLGDESTTFTDCSFETPKYAAWFYGNGTYTIENCYFNSANGRFFNIYSEGKIAPTVIAKNSTFVDSSDGSDSNAVFNIKTNAKTTLTVTGCTFEGASPKYKVESANGSVVTFDGIVVYGAN